MNKSYFNLKNKEKIIQYLENENIFYHVSKDHINYDGTEDQLCIYTNNKNDEENIIIDFKNDKVKINTYFNDSLFEKVDGAEFDWEPHGFSIRFFKDENDISSNLFYNIRKN